MRRSKNAGPANHEDAANLAIIPAQQAAWRYGQCAINGILQLQSIVEDKYRAGSQTFVRAWSAV